MLTMKTKLCLIGALVVLVLLAFWRYEGKNDTIDELKTENVTTKVENGALKETVADQQGSAATTEKVNVQVTKESNELRETAKVIQRNTDTKVKQIDNEYAKLPETVENQVAKDIERSSAVSDGMWATYCAVQPEAEACATPTQ